jgi:hypothetical protein
MTLAWSTIAAGFFPPPLAILVFYCPTFYDPLGMQRNHVYVYKGYQVVMLSTKQMNH